MKFGFDGKGINDYAAEYKPRIATLTEHGHAINAGPLLAAAPDLLAALEECITDDPGAACHKTGKKTRRLQAISDIARAAIAKAKGLT